MQGKGTFQHADGNARSNNRSPYLHQHSTYSKATHSVALLHNNANTCYACSPQCIGGYTPARLKPNGLITLNRAHLQPRHMPVPCHIKELQIGMLSRQHQVPAAWLQHNTRRAAAGCTAAGPIACGCQCCCCWWRPEAVDGQLYCHCCGVDEAHGVV
jgi:hypothetical protein